MAIDIIGPAANYTVVICTNLKSGTSGATAEPDVTTTGTACYFIPKTIGGQLSNKEKFKNIAGFVYSDQTGTREEKVDLGEFYVWANGEVSPAQTASEVFEKYWLWFKQRLTAGKTPIYIFFYNRVESRWVKWGNDTACTIAYPYIYGKFLSVDWKLEESDAYIMNISIMQCTQ